MCWGSGRRSHKISAVERPGKPSHINYNTNIKKICVSPKFNYTLPFFFSKALVGNQIKSRDSVTTHFSIIY